ncbi:hypothetical protein AAHC03_05287 [Spirometra sp. Aus1]
MSRRGTSLHVKNLADGVRHEELRRVFGKYGHLLDVTVPVNFHTGRPKGFAFVEFEDRRDAEDALHYLNQTRLWGREISVEFTRGTRKTPAEMRLRDQGSRSRRDNRSYRPRSRSRSRSRSYRGRRDRLDDSDRKEYSARRPARSISRSPSADGRAKNGRRQSSVRDDSPVEDRWRDDRRSRPRSSSIRSRSGDSRRPSRQRSKGDRERSPVSERGSRSPIEHNDYGAKKDEYRRRSRSDRSSPSRGRRGLSSSPEAL